MLERIKEIGGIGSGLILMVFVFAGIILFVKGSFWVLLNLFDLFAAINTWVFGLILLLVFISVVPKMRIYTGLGIHYLTYIWGALFWLLCLGITYQYWGIIGILVGIIFLGLGVFFTAFLVALFNGGIMAALMIVLNLAMIYGVRALGYWITTKYPKEEDAIKEKAKVVE